jgi:hypothetical protein
VQTAREKLRACAGQVKPMNGSCCGNGKTRQMVQKNGYMPEISICYIAVVVCVVVLKPLFFLWFGPVFGSDIWAWRI